MGVNPPGLATMAVAPMFSVTLEPGEQILSAANGSATTVRVGVTCNLTGAQPGTLRLEIPPSWRAQPDDGFYLMRLYAVLGYCAAHGVPHKVEIV